MNPTTVGFSLAALYNLCIVVFSRGFSDVLGEADPLVLETRREYDLVVRARRIGAREVEGL